MSRGVAALLGAQFLTAFADNAMLFTGIALLIESPRGDWYVPALQSAFLVAFVVLAPWVGSLADRRPKPHVLLLGNVLKGAGASLMFVGVEPMAAYALVGTGAAVYSPAKYGILRSSSARRGWCAPTAGSRARRSPRSCSVPPSARVSPIGPCPLR